MATLSDVAALAGVSVSAVSRVLTNAPLTRVRPETRERIHNAAKELNYHPNFAGRALKLARSNVIALIVPDLTNSLFAELMHGVEDEALEHDYVVVLSRAPDMQPGGETIKKLLSEGRVDGVLLQLGDEVVDDVHANVFDPRTPVVFINSIEAGNAGSVSLPNEFGARVGTEHLIKLGHRRIGLVGGARGGHTTAVRELGFREAMADASLPVNEEYVMSVGYKPTDGAKALRVLMAQISPPTALLVANVNAAIGALGEATQLGIEIPNELSIVAVHDVWTAEYTWPPLTTVHMPLYELGRRAVDSIFNRLNGQEGLDLVVTSPPKLVIRQSAAALTQ